ncbi:helix-turn-helix domain-containing protein [Streptomyces sp. ME18-1-4]|uniref:helix-turn-helix domain-containing protein n=1 Tax=Streptomyces sp. ME18-1-4 TaxID=3028685 RepID=UPI0029A79477|nr:helix-turn-helix domain-containing protein [Streptomyces sp. ME18-1-4]MDX3243483.1 helix-turn-helix domain-containing protein [Streptomyces sp. ME18-1-4]
MAPTSGDTDRHLQRLATLVRQRRVALGFASKEAAADACGISHTTYRKVEGTRTAAPQRVNDTTYTKLDKGFGFQTSSKAVADGVSDSITVTDGTELIEGGQIRDFKSADLEDELDRAFDKSAQLTAPHLTLSESKALKDEMFRVLRERGAL